MAGFTRTALAEQLGVSVRTISRLDIPLPKWGRYDDSFFRDWLGRGLDELECLVYQTGSYYLLWKDETFTRIPAKRGDQCRDTTLQEKRPDLAHIGSGAIVEDHRERRGND